MSDQNVPPHRELVYEPIAMVGIGLLGALASLIVYYYCFLPEASRFVTSVGGFLASVADWNGLDSDDHIKFAVIIGVGLVLGGVAGVFVGSRWAKSLNRKAGAAER